MAKLTLKYLEAQNEALRALVDAQGMQIRKLFSEVDTLKVMAARATMPVSNYRALSAKAQSYAQQGIACHIKAGKIIATKTGEILP